MENLLNLSISELKVIFSIGARFNSYYGNGEYKGIDIVTKVNDKSCWINTSRKSWNTIKEYCDLKIYRT